MISFFKFQDPFRFSMILIILLIIRLPVLIYGYPLLIPELTWMLIGEKVGDGFVLYKEIWTGLEPFSAWIYFLMDSIFGKSQFAYQFLSLVIIFIQAILFNFVVSINNLYPDKTYVPALLYVVFSSLFFDFYTLSPPLLGMTFILLAMHFVFFQIRTVAGDENLFYTGALIAIASLFYFPFLIFILLVIISFLLFSGVVLRKYFLLLTGFVFPYILVGVYYFLRGGLPNFLSSFSLALLSDTELLVSGTTLGVTLIVPAAILVVSIFVISANSRYINYQYVVIRIFSFWLILSAVTLYFTRTLSAYHLFVFVPPLAFFGAHLFLLLKNKLTREISFAVCLIAILWINYGILYEFAFRKTPIAYDEMVVNESPETTRFKDKKLLVLGNDKSYYKDNHLATPYFNWELSQQHFKDLNNYKNLSSIYSNFINDMPDVIVDEKNVIPLLFKRLPKLEKEYNKLPGKNMYVRKESRI